MSLQATRQLAELVGHPPEGVTSVHRNGDGWTVTVEVLELRRVPNTSDVLASYQVEVGVDGSVTGYQRGRRYTRAQTED